MLRILFPILLSVMVWNSSYARSKAIADSCLQVINSEKNLSNNQHCELLYQVILNNTDPDTCIFYADQLIDISELSDNQLFLQRGYYEKGQAYILKCKYEESLKCLQKSLDISLINQMKLEVGLSYYLMSYVLNNTNNNKQAIEYLERSINIFKKDTIYVTYLMGAFYQLGNICFQLQEFDSSLFYYRKVLPAFEKHNHDTAVGYIWGNIGAIHSKFNHTDSARLYLNKAIELLKKNNDYQVLIIFLVDASRNELNDNKVNKALELISQAKMLVDRYPQLESSRNVYEQLSKVYAAMGDYAKAFHYQKEYYTLRDSLVNLDLVTEMANMRTEFEVGQKQAEVDKLEEINRAQSRTVLMMVIGLLLVSVLLVFIWFGYRQKLVLSRKLKHQKAELVVRTNEIEQVNSAKDRLFSVISHDLRGPVGVLRNLATLIVRALDDRNMKEVRELSVAMSDSSQQVEFLLDNLLHWSISRQKLYKPKKEAVELNRLVREVLSVYVQTAKAKQIQLSFNPCHSSITIESDPNCLATIIRNLVNNALKFTHIGGKVEVTACNKDGQAEIRVSDNGIGMTPDQVSNLFDFAGKRSEWGTQNEKGQGLGLCLVHDFVTMQDGTIEIESEPGKGSTFIVLIPARVIQLEEMPVLTT